MNTYTLFELADLAIGTPEIGAVNFNILHLLLKKILRESRLGERTVRYRSVDATTLMAKVLREKGEISLSDIGKIDEDLDEKIEDVESSEEVIKIEESTNTGSEIWPAPELQELFTSVQSLEENLEKVKQNIESLERQMKRTKRDMVKKTEYEEVQKRDKDSRFDLDREEFEEAVEEIRDSIAELANKLHEQEQSSVGSAKEEAINKLCEKAAEEQIAKRQGDFNDRLKSLTSTVANLQDVVKEILYPQAAGVTKCVTCGRTARLPNMGLLSEIPGDTRADRKLQELAKKAPVKKKENQKKHELKFTLLSLDNLKKAARLPASKLLQQDQEQPLTADARIESQENGKQEKRSDDVFNIEDATSAFMPLRLIPDPTRAGTLLADEIHINPKVMSVSVIGVQKPQKLRLEVKPTKDENA
ncbi:hypothetical protein AVEN_245270-1 [Araneus ventricosus]|uniref:Glutamine-rich protein 2 n=1 Tax=Araneus ventricosus TaxID=182803 RepID=A0A4Y2EE50_ARAVE|nr:hypothetical protein AVEN_245270-1 [Araneus ventricosus]